MATIVSISSRVVRGTVGNTLSSFVLQRMGHVVREVPTVVWDRHPGLGRPSGFAVSGDDLSALLRDQTAPEQSAATAMVATGYFNRPDQITAVRDFILALRARGHRPKICVDPVCGDAPGLYVSREVLEALRDLLVPLADVITPNRFELGLLTGMPVSSNAEIIEAAHVVHRPVCLVTSAFGGAPDRIANILAMPDAAWICESPRRTSVPNGTGDLMSALLAGWLTKGVSPETALARASAGVDAVLDVTPTGALELAVVAAQDAFARDRTVTMTELRT